MTMPTVKTSDMSFQQKRDLNYVSIVFDDPTVPANAPLPLGKSALNTPTANSGTNIRLVNALAQGAKPYQRKLDQVTGWRIEWSAVAVPIRIDSTVATDAIKVQTSGFTLILFSDSRPGGAFPVQSDVVASFDQSGAMVSTATSPLNPQNVPGRFTIHHREWVTLPGFNSGSAIITDVQVDRIDPQQKLCVFEGYKSLDGLVATFSQSTALDVTAFTGNPLYIMTICDAPVAGYNLYGCATYRFYS